MGWRCPRGAAALAGRLARKRKTGAKPQTSVAVCDGLFLIDPSVSAPNVASKILPCKDCFRVGKIGGILFALVREPGCAMGPAVGVLTSYCL